MEFINKNSKLLMDALLTHIELVFVSVGIGFLIAVPFGIFLSRHKKQAQYILALISIVQTIPGLVLL